MRIVRLNLDAFGPFAGESLDFSSAGPNLHLVYGSNEAGKTSTLRALNNLFYGIPHRSTDNFRFDHNKMRLSAILEHSDGSNLEFVRFKRIKDPLCEADGATPIDQSRLDRFLGGVDASLFETMFGIGHDALIKGGKEILNGGGKLGELLFAASSGIAGLQSIQEALRADREIFFNDSGRGKVQRIPRSIAEVNEAKARIKEVQVTTDEWSRRFQDVRDARDEASRIEKDRLEKSTEASRLRRIQKALKFFPEREAILGQLADLGDVIILADDFSMRRQEAERRRDQSAFEIDRTSKAIDDLSVRRQAIDVPALLLDAGAEIDALHVRQGEFRKAQLDRPGLLFSQQEHEHAARDILQAIGRPRDLALAESLQVRADEVVLIRKLATLAEKRSAERETILDAIPKHRRRVEELARDLASIEPSIDLDPLRSTLKSAVKLGDIEARLDVARQTLEPLEKKLATEIKKLPGWPRSAEELEESPIPLAETIERFEARFQDEESTRKQLETDRSREETAIAELLGRLQVETRQRDLPTEEDLARSRRFRDEAWRLLRASGLKGSDDPSLSASIVAELAPGRTLLDAFELGITRADELADRLRREAAEIARRAGQLADLEAHRGRLSQVDRERSEAEMRLENFESDWRTLTEPLGFPAFGPSELRAWLVKREKILDSFEKVRTQRSEVDRLGRQIAEQVSRLSTTLTELGLAPASFDDRLAPLIEFAQARIKAHDKAQGDRKTTEATLATNRADLAENEQKLVRIDLDADAWRVRWADSLSKIGLESSATPDQAIVFLDEIAKFEVQRNKARGFLGRVQAIDRDRDRFADDVAALLGRVAPDLASEALESVVETVYARLKSAREDDQACRSLQEQAEKEDTALNAAARSRAEALLELASLCREANCADVDALSDAERRSGLRMKLDADLSRCESQIRDLSAGASIDAFLAEASAIDPDGLDLNLADLDREIDNIQARLSVVNQTIGGRFQLLSAIDGSGKAAEANEQAGYALARLQADVPRYAALRIAAHVLQQGIERYRDRAQGPLVRRASDLFRTLTAGSFGGLRIDYDDRGNALLVGVRPDGSTTLSVQSMSDGSCDQLYLSLRIASLENWLSAHEPIPLIVDDILLQFDDTRSLSALRVLGELSRRTQVIFFTHHRHLLDLSRSSFSPECLSIHELSPTPPLPTPASP